MQRLLFGAHGCWGSEKNFRVHLTHSPDWRISNGFIKFNILHDFFQVFPTIENPEMGGALTITKGFACNLRFASLQLFSKSWQGSDFRAFRISRTAPCLQQSPGQVVSNPFNHFICFFPVTRYFSLTRKSFRIFSLWAVFPTHHKWIHALNWQTILQAHNRYYTFTYHS